MPHFSSRFFSAFIVGLLPVIVLLTGGCDLLSDNGSGSTIPDVLWHSYAPGFSESRRFTYLSPLGVGENYMVNVGSEKIYGLTRPCNSIPLFSLYLQTDAYVTRRIRGLACCRDDRSRAGTRGSSDIPD